MFRVGDEVVCIDAGPSCYSGIAPLAKGSVYVVDAIDSLPPEPDGTFGVFLVGVPTPPPSTVGWASRRFRKVQKRSSDLSIETFLTIKPGFEEPRKTTPARKRERAS